MQWRPLKFIFDSPPAQQIYLSTVLTFILLTAWFQVSQPPLFSSPLMAGAEPVKPADKSVKKSSSSKVSQFGILISASLCSNCPLKSYFVTTKAQQFPSAQLNFHSIDSLISGLTVASFLLPSYGCCRPRQASRQVCKETQQLEGEQISFCQARAANSNSVAHIYFLTPIRAINIEREHFQYSHDSFVISKSAKIVNKLWQS